MEGDIDDVERTGCGGRLDMAVVEIGWEQGGKCGPIHEGNVAVVAEHLCQVVRESLHRQAV